jgi:hypothetical protein
MDIRKALIWMVLALRLFKGPELDQGHAKNPVVVCALGVTRGCPAQVNKYIHNCIQNFDTQGKDRSLGRSHGIILIRTSEEQNMKMWTRLDRPNGRSNGKLIYTWRRTFGVCNRRKLFDQLNYINRRTMYYGVCYLLKLMLSTSLCLIFHTYWVVRKHNWSFDSGYEFAYEWVMLWHWSGRPWDI